MNIFKITKIFTKECKISYFVKYKFDKFSWVSIHIDRQRKKYNSIYHFLLYLEIDIQYF